MLFFFFSGADVAYRAQWFIETGELLMTCAWAIDDCSMQGAREQWQMAKRQIDACAAGVAFPAELLDRHVVYIFLNST